MCHLSAPRIVTHKNGKWGPNSHATHYLVLLNLCKQEKTGLDNFILGKSLDGSEEKDFSGGEGWWGKGLFLLSWQQMQGRNREVWVEGEEGGERVIWQTTSVWQDLVRRNSQGWCSCPGWGNWVDVPARSWGAQEKESVGKERKWGLWR